MCEMVKLNYNNISCFMTMDSIVKFKIFKNVSSLSKLSIVKANVNKAMIPQPNSNSSRPRKIIDCFIFYNELDMLAYRLHALNPVVDYFVIVEARQTFVGANKPLHFKESMHDPRFEQYSEKIIHVGVELPHRGNIDISQNHQWANERFQRNCISRGIDKIAAHLNPDDAIIVSDVDEIPDPNTLEKIKKDELLTHEIFTLEQDFYYYNLNSKHNEKWNKCKMVTFKKYKEFNQPCEVIRFIDGKPISKGGWHLSYFGDAKFIKNKLQNFSHQEYNSEQYTDLEEIQKKIDAGSDLFTRTVHLQQVDVCDNAYLPPFYKTHLASFFYEPDTKAIKAQKYCFIHSCTLVHGETGALDCLVDKINASGLIDALDAVFINNIGIPIEHKCCNNAKYQLTNYSENEKLYENPTLNKLKEFSEKNKDSHVLYLHTKGVSYKRTYDCINDWTNMMLHFLVEKYEDCFRALDGAYDTVGCNYNPEPMRHYSGNFWWAKTNYVSMLPALDEENPNKMSPEFWLFQNNPDACTLHSSGVNHYHQMYPRERYLSIMDIN
jgi:beta-1,4-mannosyl-glycoprotein beta-1,4-N-acetylglucosaminyltransferase